MKKHQLPSFVIKDILGTHPYSSLQYCTSMSMNHLHANDLSRTSQGFLALIGVITDTNKRINLEKTEEGKYFVW